MTFVRSLSGGVGVSWSATDELEICTSHTHAQQQFAPFIVNGVMSFVSRVYHQLLTLTNAVGDECAIVAAMTGKCSLESCVVVVFFVLFVST